MNDMSNPYDPNAVPPDQSPEGYSPAPYGQGYPPAAPDHPQGTTVLVLGIIGIFFTICAPIAWYLGSKALKEIRASGISYANEQNIVIGRILGIVFTILAIVALVITIIFVIIAIVAASTGVR
jgi:hypothetical protein